mmetsp:Transcript_31040/g.90187  ORF Transcript_31040/g.90187 Transcript_31040/m.90187 type:complete len:233 (+) Transcript_31040:1572-2270(+)
MPVVGGVLVDGSGRRGGSAVVTVTGGAVAAVTGCCFFLPSSCLGRAGRVCTSIFAALSCVVVGTEGGGVGVGVGGGAARPVVLRFDSTLAHPSSSASLPASSSRPFFSLGDLEVCVPPMVAAGLLLVPSLPLPPLCLSSFLPLTTFEASVVATSAVLGGTSGSGVGDAGISSSSRMPLGVVVTLVGVVVALVLELLPPETGRAVCCLFACRLRPLVSFLVSAGFLATSSVAV